MVSDNDIEEVVNRLTESEDDIVLILDEWSASIRGYQYVTRAQAKLWNPYETQFYTFEGIVILRFDSGGLTFYPKGEICHIGSQTH